MTKRRRAGILLVGAALLALPGGCANRAARPVAPADMVALDLDTIVSRRSELDGRWVEFDAYVRRFLSGDFLIGLPGRAIASDGGAPRTLCRGTEDTNLPILPAGGYGPLRRSDLATGPRLPKVRVRAIFRNRAHEAPGHPMSFEWPAYFERATILARTGEYCDED